MSALFTDDQDDALWRLPRETRLHGAPWVELIPAEDRRKCRGQKGDVRCRAIARWRYTGADQAADTSGTHCDRHLAVAFTSTASDGRRALAWIEDHPDTTLFLEGAAHRRARQ